MTGKELNTWVDVSSLVTGVVLERHVAILEDACWLCLANSAQHINLVELDATLKGLNLVLQWQCRIVHLYTLIVVYHRLSDVLMGGAQVRTKAA